MKHMTTRETERQTESASAVQEGGDSCNGVTLEGCHKGQTGLKAKPRRWQVSEQQDQAGTGSLEQRGQEIQRRCDS